MAVVSRKGTKIFWLGAARSQVQANHDGAQLSLFKSPRRGTFWGGSRIQRQGEGDGVAEISGSVPDLHGQAEVQEGQSWMAGGIQVEKPGHLPPLVFGNGDRAGRLRTPPRLIDRGVDGLHLPFRVCRPEVDLPGFSGTDFPGSESPGDDGRAGLPLFNARFQGSLGFQV